MNDLYFHDIEDGESPDAWSHMTWLKKREYLVKVEPPAKGAYLQWVIPGEIPEYARVFKEPEDA
jgi:hypothetical protein